jgi:hypothetical protein
LFRRIVLPALALFAGLLIALGLGAFWLEPSSLTLNT